MRMTLYWLSFFFLLSPILEMSCEQSSHCEVDEIVKKKFENKFENIKNTNLDQGIGGQLLVDIFFMQEMTGIESSVNFGDVSYYEDKKDIKKDLRKWNAWYEKNKCNISRDSIIVLENRIIDSNPWIGFSD